MNRLVVLMILLALFCTTTAVTEERDLPRISTSWYTLTPNSPFSAGLLSQSSIAASALVFWSAQWSEPVYYQPENCLPGQPTSLWSASVAPGWTYDDAPLPLAADDCCPQCAPYLDFDPAALCLCPGNASLALAGASPYLCVSPSARLPFVTVDPAVFAGESRLYIRVATPPSLRTRLTSHNASWGNLAVSIAPVTLGAGFATPFTYYTIERANVSGRPFWTPTPASVSNGLGVPFAPYPGDCTALWLRTSLAQLGDGFVFNVSSLVDQPYLPVGPFASPQLLRFHSTSELLPDLSAAVLPTADAPLSFVVSSLGLRVAAERQQLVDGKVSALLEFPPQFRVDTEQGAQLFVAALERQSWMQFAAPLYTRRGLELDAFLVGFDGSAPACDALALNRTEALFASLLDGLVTDDAQLTDAKLLLSLTFSDAWVGCQQFALSLAAVTDAGAVAASSFASTACRQPLGSAAYAADPCCNATLQLVAPVCCAPRDLHGQPATRARPNATALAQQCRRQRDCTATLLEQVLSFAAALKNLPCVVPSAGAEPTSVLAACIARHQTACAAADNTHCLDSVCLDVAQRCAGPPAAVASVEQAVYDCFVDGYRAALSVPAVQRAVLLALGDADGANATYASNAAYLDRLHALLWPYTCAGSTSLRRDANSSSSSSSSDFAPWTRIDSGVECRRRPGCSWGGECRADTEAQCRAACLVSDEPNRAASAPYACELCMAYFGSLPPVDAAALVYSSVCFDVSVEPGCYLVTAFSPPDDCRQADGVYNALTQRCLLPAYADRDACAGAAPLPTVWHDGQYHTEALCAGAGYCALQPGAPAERCAATAFYCTGNGSVTDDAAACRQLGVCASQFPQRGADSDYCARDVCPSLADALSSCSRYVGPHDNCPAGLDYQLTANASTCAALDALCLLPLGATYSASTLQSAATCAGCLAPALAVGAWQPAQALPSLWTPLRWRPRTFAEGANRWAAALNLTQLWRLDLQLSRYNVNMQWQQAFACQYLPAVTLLNDFSLSCQLGVRRGSLAALRTPGPIVCSGAAAAAVDYSLDALWLRGNADVLVGGQPTACAQLTLARHSLDLYASPQPPLVLSPSFMQPPRANASLQLVRNAANVVVGTLLADGWTFDWPSPSSRIDGNLTVCFALSPDQQPPAGHTILDFAAPVAGGLPDAGTPLFYPLYARSVWLAASTRDAQWLPDGRVQVVTSIGARPLPPVRQSLFAAFAQSTRVWLCTHVDERRQTLFPIARQPNPDQRRYLDAFTGGQRAVLYACIAADAALLLCTLLRAVWTVLRHGPLFVSPMRKLLLLFAVITGLQLVYHALLAAGLVHNQTPANQFLVSFPPFLLESVTSVLLVAWMDDTYYSHAYNFRRFKRALRAIDLIFWAAYLVFFLVFCLIYALTPAVDYSLARCQPPAQLGAVQFVFLGYDVFALAFLVALLAIFVFYLFRISQQYGFAAAVPAHLPFWPLLALLFIFAYLLQSAVLIAGVFVATDFTATLVLLAFANYLPFAFALCLLREESIATDADFELIDRGSKPPDTDRDSLSLLSRDELGD